MIKKEKISKDPLDLTKYLGKAKNRIERVGVELEGGWLKLPPGVNNLATDSSVRITAPTDEEYLKLESRMNEIRREYEVAGSSRRLQIQNEANEVNNKMQKLQRVKLKTGEIPSPILEPNKVESWMKENYPSHVNDTCGLHVHMSFKSARHYGMLMIPEYQNTIREYIKQWATEEKLESSHPIWDRLSGKNEFCKFEFFPDLQASKTHKEYNHNGEGNRYTAISYRSGEHGTIECRLLPMMSTVELGIRAVNRVLSITNASLLYLREKEEKVKAELVIAGDMVRVRQDRRLYV